MDIDRRGFITMVGAIALSPKDAIAVTANPPASVVLPAAAQVNITLPPWPPGEVVWSGCFWSHTYRCPYHPSGWTGYPTNYATAGTFIGTTHYSVVKS
jgi:hypothetical protein